MPRHSKPEIWTTRRLLDWTTDYFKRKQLDNPRLSAEMLLAHILGTQRIKLYMELDRPAGDLERAAFRDLVERAVAHEPIQYLVGHVPFFTLDLKLTPDVLIPRPETEHLVEHIIHRVRSVPGFHQPTIADIGTGSGAIAIALAANLPKAAIIATDLSEKALVVAQANAERHGLADRIEFIQGDLYQPLGNRRFHFLVSNPPYISDSEWRQVPPNVKNHEPTHALRAGVDGLKFLRPLVHQAPGYLNAPGQIVFEISSTQELAALELVAETEALTNPHVMPDAMHRPRFLIADRPAPDKT